MTIKEFENYEPVRWKCPKCQKPLESLDKREPVVNSMCEDCYYGELGEEIEKHPIGPSIVRHPPKTKHKYQR